MKLQIAECRLLIAIVALCSTLSALTRQTMQDEHAVYELPSSETASFRTVYEVSTATPAVYFLQQPETNACATAP